MKTHLPEYIRTLDEAKAFLRALHANGEAFHPEDNAPAVHFGAVPAEHRPSADEGHRLNALMRDIYKLPREYAFDPCAFLLSLDHEHKRFFWKDKTGRGYTNTFAWENLKDDEDTTNWDGKSLSDWCSEAEIGEEFENAEEKYTRIK